MARQPDSIEGLTLDLSGLPSPSDTEEREPIVGDIYRSQAGQPAYWWIVGHVSNGMNWEAFIYLTFNMRGEIVGTGRAAGYYLAKRPRVGFMPIPPLQPEWIL